MEAAASAAAFIQAADMCINIARKLIHKVRVYRQANEMIEELVIRIEGIWTKTETQLMALSRVRDHQNDRLLDFHENCVRTLVTKLYAATGEIEAFAEGEVGDLSLSQLTFDPNKRKRIRFSLLEKHLQQTVENLEKWHGVFDPSWFLITLRNDHEFDAALQEQPAGSQKAEELNVVLDVRKTIQEAREPGHRHGSIFRDGNFVVPEQTPIAFSSLLASTLSDKGEKVIINTTTYPQEVDKRPVVTHVRDLARILATSQPWTLGLLQCKGVIKQLGSDGEISQFQYIFSLPPTPQSTPSSLRARLLGPSPSLDVKYKISESVTRGVLAVHCADFVHKNIRPDNIVVFESSQKGETRAYLVGFEHSRPAGPNTSLTGDMVWHRNIYRHPGRQGTKPEEVYSMQHDIYSLGVCLLEIGIWSSLVLPSEKDYQPGFRLHIAEQLALRNPLQAAAEIKEKLIGMAVALLPSLMGTTFTEIVLSCLTCLDSNATNMFSEGNDLYDEDGILVGVVFIEKVLARMMVPLTI